MKHFRSFHSRSPTNAGLRFASELQLSELFWGGVGGEGNGGGEVKRGVLKALKRGSSTKRKLR